MSVNDILVQGAEPLFFLDYFACGKLNVDVATDVVRGIADGCLESGCSLIGGETAEMPGMYAEGEYDLAGFAVGAVEKNKIIDGGKLKAGDVIIGLASSGFHSNGYSLVRKLIQASQLDLSTEFELGKTWAQAILEPTRLYVKPILELLPICDIHAMSHITGGGITGNLTRVFSNNLSAEIKLNALPQDKLFTWAKEVAEITTFQMLETFNCGIGYVVIVDKLEENRVREILLTKNNIKTYVLGRVINRDVDEIIYI